MEQMTLKKAWSTPAPVVICSGYLMRSITLYTACLFAATSPIGRLLPDSNPGAVSGLFYFSFMLLNMADLVRL
jgi:hypothetical protein